MLLKHLDQPFVRCGRLRNHHHAAGVLVEAMDDAGTQRVGSAQHLLIKPLLIADDVPSLGKVVIGTVRGDLHDIGKNLVGIMLRGAGFEVIDLGADVASDSFVETAEAEGASVIGLSALLTTTMSGMKDVVELVKSKGLEGKVKVIIGGAPLSQAFADDIGADGYGYDATNAVDIVKSLAGAA